MLARQLSNPAAQSGEVAVSQRLALRARAAGNDTLALRTLLDAEHLVPDNPRLLYDAGILEDSMQLYWDANQSVTHLRAHPGGSAPPVLYLAGRPSDPTAHYGMGRILQLQEHFDQARAEFQKSLVLQPLQTESQFQLGQIDLGHNQQAINEYARTLAGDPRHGGALAGNGIALFRLRQYAQAAIWLRKATAAARTYQPAHYYIGLSLARLGQTAAAQAELAQSARMAQVQNAQSAQRLRLKQPHSATPATLQ